MKSNEDNKTWISNIVVPNNFLCLKQVYCCLTFVCVYILLWQDLSVVTTIFDIVFLAFIFYCDVTFMLLPQYLTLCSWPSYFTVTILSFTTIFDIVYLTFIFYCDKTFLLLPQYWTLCSWPSYFTVTILSFTTIFDIVFLTFIFYFHLTKPFCCYNNWHCVFDLHILPRKDLSVVTTLFDIVFLTFIFYCDNSVV